MFGSNSSRNPERASDQRVRLAHPSIPNSIIKQRCNKLVSLQRQPSIILLSKRRVKPENKRQRKIPSDFPDSAPFGTARLPIPLPMLRRRSPSGSSLIVTTVIIRRNPSRHNNIHRAEFENIPALRSSTSPSQEPGKLDVSSADAEGTRPSGPLEHGSPWAV
jgi:hypothetical protein